MQAVVFPFHRLPNNYKTTGKQDCMHIGNENVITRRCNRDALERIIQLYDAWNAAQPAQGHDQKAAEWRAKRAAWQATTQAVATQPIASGVP